ERQAVAGHGLGSDAHKRRRHRSEHMVRPPMPSLSRLPGLRQIPQAVGRIRDDVVLFESWRGQFSDNPRAISEELHSRGVDLKHVWVIDPSRAGEVPDWVIPVEPEGWRHLAMMGRARYLVANGTVLGFHRKR